MKKTTEGKHPFYQELESRIEEGKLIETVERIPGVTHLTWYRRARNGQHLSAKDAISYLEHLKNGDGERLFKPAEFFKLLWKYYKQSE